MRGGGADLDALVGSARSQSSRLESIDWPDIAHVTSGNPDYSWFQNLVERTGRDASLRPYLHAGIASVLFNPMVAAAARVIFLPARGAAQAAFRKAKDEVRR